MMERDNVYRSILNSIDVAIVAVNEKGIIFYANEKYAQHIGKELSSIMDKRLQDVYLGSTTITALKTGKKVVVEKKVCPVDDNKFVTGIATPIYEGNELIGA